MKKVYKKPAIYIETFELMEHIARCTANPDVTNVTYRGPESCAYNDTNLSLFYSQVSACVVNEVTLANPDNEFYGMIDDLQGYMASLGVDQGGCYNAFSDGNFFAS